ncbi:MAG: TonB-dependent receptor, partial [Acidobacteria bacterium]
MRKFRRHISLVSLVVGFAALVWAQSTAQISGAVRDQSGAILPGVEITVTQTETGIKRSTMSNETGSYVLPNLPIGPYRLDASLQGFRTYAQSGIVLQVASNPVINLVLEVVQVTETIEVQSNAALVETQATGISQVVENTRILELPLNGRQATDLMVLAGSAVNQGAATSLSMNGGVRISVAGGQSFGVQYLLDGARHNNAYDNLNMPLPFPDALQEFRVETSAMTANNGGHSGAAVNAVTKSGTNEFHGDVFEFVRNYKFNSVNRPYTTKNESLKRNQFGGTIGGPIMRNKVFFFGAYQGTTTRQDPSDIQSFVPTAQMLAGDFTTYASAQCNSSGPITLRGITNNTVSPAQFSKAALYIASKLPKTSDPCGKIIWGTKVKQNEGQGIGRIDYQRTATDSIFGRYMFTTFKATPPYQLSPENVLTTSVGGRDNLAESFSLGDTHLFGAGTVNSFRLAFNRAAVHRTKADFFSGPDAGINMYTYVPHYMILSVTGGGFNLGGATEGEYRNLITSYSA